MISGRVQRIHDVVMADMECYEPDYYVERLKKQINLYIIYLYILMFLSRCKELTTSMNDDHLKQFANTVTKSVENLESTNEIDMEELISASTVICTSVHEVYQ